MSKETISLAPETYEYLKTFGYHEPPILKSLRIYTENLPGSHMRIAPEVGQFLALLIQLKQAKSILELGTFYGYSTLWMALTLADEGRLITCDIDPNAPKIAESFWREAGVRNKIDFRLGPAIQTLEALKKKNICFDLIFVDADKMRYLDYYELGLSLLGLGGVMAIDNTLGYRGSYLPNVKTSAAQAIDKLNKYIHEDPRVTMSMLPMGDGLTLIMKK